MPMPLSTREIQPTCLEQVCDFHGKERHSRQHTKLFELEKGHQLDSGYETDYDGLLIKSFTD
jgi:hypothetical protein